MKSFFKALALSAAVMVLFLALSHCSVGLVPDSRTAGWITVLLGVLLGSYSIWRSAQASGSASVRGPLLYLILTPLPLFGALVVLSFSTQCARLPF